MMWALPIMKSMDLWATAGLVCVWQQLFRLLSEQDISLLAQEPPEEQAETVIQPGGDPDAGMPADQAEIHGTERHPVPDTEPEQEPEPEPVETNEQGDPPITDTLDNIDEDDVDPVDNNIDDSRNVTVTQPPDSD